MFQSVNSPRQTASGSAATSPRAMTLRIAAAVLAGSLVSGCAYLKRDHVEVGSVPDDYRTNHPIVISEKQEAIDIPIGATDERVTKAQKAAIMGFLDKYEPAGGAVVQILVPSGSANEAAVAGLSHQVIDLVAESGVPRHKIILVPYHAGSAEASAPIRLTYTTMAASAGQCGRWPDDILKSSENKHYANFGCSYQNNLAAQVANPADLLGPRKSSEIDAERRVGAIEDYRDGNLNVRGDTNYGNP